MLRYGKCVRFPNLLCAHTVSTDTLYKVTQARVCFNIHIHTCTRTTQCNYWGQTKVQRRHKPTHTHTQAQRRDVLCSVARRRRWNNSGMHVKWFLWFRCVTCPRLSRTSSLLLCVYCIKHTLLGSMQTATFSLGTCTQPTHSTANKLRLGAHWTWRLCYLCVATGHVRTSFGND